MVRESLILRREDRFVLVADEATRVIAAEVLREVQKVGTPVEAFVLEARGPRPMRQLPREIAYGLERATVSLLMCAPQPGEVSMRLELIDIALARGLRHAHAPGLMPRMVREGGRADPKFLAHRNGRLLARFGRAREVRFKSALGTDLRAVLDPANAWDSNTGVIHPGVFANLPAGQVSVLPGETEGTFVADGSLSEWFGPRYGVLTANPVTFIVEKNRVRDVQCPNAAIAREVKSYLRGDPEGNRVGEIGIGTNNMVPGMIGIVLQDELYPTGHLGLGLPHRGAKVNWTARINLVGTMASSEVFADGDRILGAGKFESWVDA
jgi:hypothetical protein